MTTTLKTGVAPEAETSFTPIRNVYVVGNPVKNPEMFFGRADVFQALGDWLAADGPPAILLKGNRRSGKTSILWQVMNGRMRDQAEAVFCDFHQVIPLLAEDDDLPRQVGLSILGTEAFKDLGHLFSCGRGGWAGGLLRLVRRCIDRIAPRRLLLLWDEHESLEEAFRVGPLSPGALEWTRVSLQLPLRFVLTGTQSFGQFLGALANADSLVREISFLSPEDAVDLVTAPLRGEVEYGQSAVAEICRLAGRHPFYIQYICQTLVSHLNATARRRDVTDGDLEEVIRFIVRNPTGHMQETWRALSLEDKRALAALAATLWRPEDSVSPDEALHRPEWSAFALGPEQSLAALRRLATEPALLETCAGGRVRFRIDILRFWIRHHFQDLSDLDGGSPAGEADTGPLAGRRCP